MSTLTLSLRSSKSVIDLGRNQWQPTPSALLHLQVFLTYSIFREHGGGLIFKLQHPTVRISAFFKVRKQRCHTGVQCRCSRPDVGCKGLCSWGKTSERIFSLVSLYLFLPGSVGSVLSRGRWPSLGVCSPRLQPLLTACTWMRLCTNGSGM